LCCIPSQGKTLVIQKAIQAINLPNTGEKYFQYFSELFDGALKQLYGQERFKAAKNELRDVRLARLVDSQACGW